MLALSLFSLLSRPFFLLAIVVVVVVVYYGDAEIPTGITLASERASEQAWMGASERARRKER